MRLTDLALADPSSLSEKYILRGDETFAVLSRLVAHGKQLFLITNSPFSFVCNGQIASKVTHSHKLQKGSLRFIARPVFYF